MIQSWNQRYMKIIFCFVNIILTNVIFQVDFDESTVMYEFSPFRFEAVMNSYKYRLEETVNTQTSTPISIAFHNLNETAIFMADEILMEHVYNTVQGFGVA